MQLIHMIAHSSEFENIMVREEEQQELSQLVRRYCPFEVKGGPEDKHGKINILIQVLSSNYVLPRLACVWFLHMFK
jgi:activating signal cointegrator complex subunit 3